MANPGGVGTKFLSVNLNKSYGSVPLHHHHHHNHHHPPHGSSSYGQAVANRVRPIGSHSSGGGGGGGGGMVVLSRPRSSQKVGPKLSVPPPLNLPSLRKEHERFDLSGSGGASTGGGGSGTGSRPTSSGLGWTKPGTVALQEKDADVSVFGRSASDTKAVDGSNQSFDVVSKVSTAYMPPSARLGGAGIPSSVSAPLAEKTSVLRGEDFPSLQAALPGNPSGLVQKQKDGSHQKQKHVVGEESSKEQIDSSPFSSLVHMRPQGHSSHHTFVSGSNENGGESHGSGSMQMPEQARKQEYFPGPLPLVMLNPRSDWADDERDTGRGFADRGRDHGLPKNEAYWDREFDKPRSSILPHKPAHNLFERKGKIEDETGKVSSSEVPNVDPYRRDVRTPSREGNSWRTSPLPKDGLNAQEIAIGRNGIGARAMVLDREIGKDNKYVPPHYGVNSRDGVTGDRESAFGRRDMGHRQDGRHQWNHTVESSISQGIERNTRDRYVNDQSNRFRGDAHQDSSASKSSFFPGGKGRPVNDPILNFSREKRVFSKSERTYQDDTFLKDFGSSSFDEHDPFSGGLVGVLKRKKDVVKQADFHDPVRESFEAELERVQKMQEQERQRIIEEQERALEHARREEEERQRLIREEEERRRRLEEEAREAAWRAEQERLEAIRRAEEQKIAREEEKQRVLMEEERRKLAARQKLLELEAKIAKRQAEALKGDSSVGVVGEKVSALVTEKDVSKAVDLDDWEDSERMVERITTSGSFDSSLNRPFDLGPRSRPAREGSSGFLDRGQPANSWRRDVFEDGNSSSFLVPNHDNGHHSPGRDLSVGGRGVTKKEFYGGAGYMSSRTYFRGGMQELQIEDFTPLKGNRWSASGVGDPFIRNTEIEPKFHENLAEKYGDVRWGQGHSRGNPRSPYPDQIYPEADDLYSYGRSRYSMRQPRVLPPPSLASSVPRTSFRGDNEHPGPSISLDNNMHYNHASRSDSTMQKGYYSGQHEKSETSEIVDVQPETTMTQEQKLEDKTTPRCDSQSSLSVSSPPNSPTHLSHDDLDESEDSPVASAATEGKEIPLSRDGSVVLNANSGIETAVAASSSISAADDDEDWPLENNEGLQEQEEYDEDEDGYEEEDEVHAGDDEHIDLTQEFDDMHLEEKGASCMMENFVLGFDEGVEVGIPSDEFDKSPRNEASTFGIPEISIGIIEEQGPVDGIQGDGHRLQPLDSSPRMCIDSTSRRTHETEQAIQDSITQPINTAVHTSPGSDLLDSQAVMSTLPVCSSQLDLPVKLPFGLFSGPSLIPSSVPAIQIGSIQMPLHLHPPVGPPVTHIHPSQPPLFQFGQLRYSSPTSQGILPVTPQSVSVIQSNVQAHYNLNQRSGGPLPIQLSQHSSTHCLIKDDVPPSVSKGRECIESNTLIHKNRAEISHAGENKVMSERGPRAEDTGHQDTVTKNCTGSSNGTVSEGYLQTASVSSLPVLREKDIRGSKAEGPQSGNKGKKFSYTARNSGMRSSFLASEASHSDSHGFQRRPRRTIQRTEFRVRENVDRRQSPVLVSSDNLGQDDRSNLTGRDVGMFVKPGSKKGLLVSKPSKQIVEPERSGSDPVSSEGTYSKTRFDVKEASTKPQSTARSGEGNLKRSICAEEDVDAPLQSGIVRVFKQPGIEAPSDGDGFIEVRSKRQMLNDRREQREKEIKAKSRVTKAPRKSQSLAQNAAASTSSNKVSASLGGEAANNFCSNFVASEGHGLVNMEVSKGFPTMVSQPLAPIGTPVAVNSDAQADKRPHNLKSLQTGSNGGKNLGPGIMFETKSEILDDVRKSLGSWDNAQINQQVLALTQTQLDEAMKPGRFDAYVAIISDHNSSVTEPTMPLASILTKDKSFSSAASPINSLLAGEKIQFGAVTSPTVLPPGSCTVSRGIGAPGSSRSDIEISHSLSAKESECTLFYEKDKHQNESCVHLEDCEAEAEAAASAVAVAAISSDEIVGNGLGTCSISVSDSKGFASADIDGINEGVEGDQHLATQSRAEECLSVALPADLSVDTPSISLWPPLPSPQNSSNQMLSHFPGGPPSHFPFYEMNPLLGGPIFAFGPHDESAGTQSQSQKTTASAPGPLATWQQCHSGVESFYGPPAGFTGPYISPPGGIPGVQAPPHMVVYNHFPVGQFGQVGLSFMGTTYIPSGKQPDWKHNPTSSAMGTGEGDMNNINMVSAERNPLTMASPVQHLAPGSPFLPMASPFAMLDVSPFQSGPDMSVQGRWSHVPASPLHTGPLSLPLRQPEAGVLPSQFSHGHIVDQSLTANRFSASRTSTPSDSSRSFPVATDSTTTQFPNELGLVDSSSSTGTGASTQGAVKKSSSGGTFVDIGKTDAVQNVGSNNSNGHSANVFKNQSAHKNQSAQQRNFSVQQYNHSAGYNYQRGGLSQKNTSGSDWSHRRMGFHGRNQSLGTEKSCPSSKMKQIYVAKQTSSGTSSVG